MMKKTMKRAMVAMMAVLALTGAAATASTSTVFAYSDDSAEAQANKIIAIVRVSKGYLALRTAPCYDERNEIGELYSGDDVEVLRRTNNGYAYVYSYKYGRCGYVNANYLF